MIEISTLLIGLAHNIALLLSLTLIYSIVKPHLNQVNPSLRAIFTGTFFGAIAIIGMSMHIQVAPGINIDGRVVIVGLSGAFFGPLSAMMSGGLVACYRIWLGGIGRLPGVCAIITGAIIGVLFYLRWGKGIRFYKSGLLFLLGIALAIEGLLMSFLLPSDIAWRALKVFILPVGLLYPLGTLFLGTLLSTVERRDEAEAALKESEERFRSTFEQAAVGIAHVAPDGRFLRINQRYCDIVGYTPEEMFEFTFQDITYPDDLESDLEYVHQVLADEIQTYSMEKRYFKKNGSIVWVNLTVSLVRESLGEPKYFIAVVENITKRKQTEEALKTAHDELELRQSQKLEAIGTLAGGIAHDFNNLLSVIMGNIELTKDDIKSELGIFEFLIEAEKASFQAQELTKQLITFSKGGAPTKKVGSIGGLVKETTNSSIVDSNIKCDFLIPPDLWFAEFDEGQMKYAIKNLTDNAVEALPDGGLIDVRANNFEFSTETKKRSLPLPEGRYVKISIRDHGVGISEEHLSKIFDPYFSTKEMGVQKGMGLGLAATYSIINRHDGHITVESEVGVGTTLTLYLPAHEKDIRKLKPVAIPKPEKPTVLTGRVLVMDDEEMIRNLSTQVLSRLGYEPELAQDGAEAIELYKRAMDSGKPFDAVILDLTVKGGMGGKDAVKALLELDSQVKTIVSSGYSNDPVMTNHRGYGFIGALPKPYTVKELRDMLNKITKD